MKRGIKPIKIPAMDAFALSFLGQTKFKDRKALYENHLEPNMKSKAAKKMALELLKRKNIYNNP